MCCTQATIASVSLTVVVLTSHIFGVVSAPGRVNATQAGISISESNKSTTWEDSPENIDAFVASNCSSSVRVNTTTTSPKCTAVELTTVSTELATNWINPFVYVIIGLSIWSMLGNILPIAAIIKQKKLHKPVYILMANLAASDVLTGISFLITGCTFAIHGPGGISRSLTMSLFLFVSLLVSGLSSAYSLLTLTAERYWFIVHGMTYEDSITNERCKIMVVVIWLWSGILAGLTVPNVGGNCAEGEALSCVWRGIGTPRVYIILILVFVFIPMTAIVFFNVSIFWCLWKHVSAIMAQEAAVHAQPSANRKSSITILIITIMFLVGWLPYCFQMVEVVGCTEDCSANRGPHFFSFIILNSAVNPVIYAFRLRDIRRAVMRLFVGEKINVAT